MGFVYLLLALVFIKTVVFYKVYRSVPLHELKRLTRQNHKKAAKLYKVAIYGPSLEVLLWAAGTASAAVLIIWSARTSWWLAAIVVAVAAWLVVWSKFPAFGWAGSFAALFSSAYAWFLSLAQPLLGRAAGWLPPGRRVHIHTGLYEKKDLLELLNTQNKQLDNRINESELKIAFNSLTFGDKKVGQVMTPRRQVKLVGMDESIGPMLMDELHKSGFSRFPVYSDSAKAVSPKIVGTLYINNLIGYEGGGKVKDLAKKEVYYINEDSNLRQALDAFLKTHHHLLIVVNSFEEMAGVLSLEDVLEQIIGKPIIDEFDSYADIRAVAAMKAEKDAKQNQTIQPEKIPETVVE